MGDKLKVGFLGTGKMGSILVRGMISSGLADAGQVTVFDVYAESSRKLGEELGVAVVESAEQAVAGSDLVFLCVKPQQFESAAAGVKDVFDSGKCAVSIMAGVKSQAVCEALGGKASVVRVMPNVACLVGQGAAAVARDTGAPEKISGLVFELFESLGAAVWVNESQMDAVTAVSGSGPAYVFMMMEALVDAGVKIGLDRDTASRLAIQTVLGSAELARQSEFNLCELRAQVSSPGGTTVAATAVLERSGFRSALIDAVAAAWKRGIELGR